VTLHTDILLGNYILNRDAFPVLHDKRSVPAKTPLNPLCPDWAKNQRQHATFMVGLVPDSSQRENLWKRQC
jgi:hypothetical protein